jgi:FkbM family methyltransferase
MSQPDTRSSAPPGRSRSRLFSLPSRAVRRLHRSWVNWRWEHLGYDFIPLIDGVRLKVHADDRLGHLLRHGDFEVSEQAFLKDYLREGDVFVDVGANIGLFTILAGRLVGPSGRVYAFEPCTQTYQRLVGNVQREGMSQIACHRLALSNATGEASLAVSQGEYGAWNSLAGALADGETKAERVPTVEWDVFSARESLSKPVTVMKIDVEGWELPVIDGARSLLQRPEAPLLQVEFTRANALAAGSSCEQLFDRIREFGYRLYTYDAVARTLNEVSAAPTIEYCNLYAIKRLQDVSRRLAAAAGDSSWQS